MTKNLAQLIKNFKTKEYVPTNPEDVAVIVEARYQRLIKEKREVIPCFVLKSRLNITDQRCEIDSFESFLMHMVDNFKKMKLKTRIQVLLEFCQFELLTNQKNHHWYYFDFEKTQTGFSVIVFDSLGMSITTSSRIQKYFTRYLFEFDFKFINIKVQNVLKGCAIFCLDNAFRFSAIDLHSMIQTKRGSKKCKNVYNISDLPPAVVVLVLRNMQRSIKTYNKEYQKDYGDISIKPAKLSSLSLDCFIYNNKRYGYNRRNELIERNYAISNKSESFRKKTLAFLTKITAEDYRMLLEQVCLIKEKLA